MKIGINSRIFQNSESGIPYFIKHLYMKLAEIDKKNKYIFFQTSDEKKLGETKLIKIPSNRISNVIFDGILVDRLIRREKIDLFHGPSHILPGIKRKKTKYIVTIHDLSFLVFPEQNSKIFNNYLRLAIGHSLKNADAIVADSLSTKEDIGRFYSIDKSRIRVIPLGVSDYFLSKEDISTQSMIKGKYFFSLTTHPKRKNIYKVLAALSKSKKLKNLKFVIAGLISNEYLLELKNEINNLKLQDNVILFGYSTEAELKNLYHHAAFFVYPSFYEGFGFPILESMACGAPVIASATSSMIEIMPQKEWLINPQSIDDIQEKMEKILEISENERKILIEKNLEFAREFTWHKTAIEYLKLYEELSGA